MGIFRALAVAARDCVSDPFLVSRRRLPRGLDAGTFRSHQEDESEMRARTLAALMALLLFAWPAAAQEQRGSIEGVIKDSSGAVLPGVTVEAKTTTGVVL